MLSLAQWSWGIGQHSKHYGTDAMSSKPHSEECTCSCPAAAGSGDSNRCWPTEWSSRVRHWRLASRQQLQYCRVGG